jgi:thermitase
VNVPTRFRNTLLLAVAALVILPLLLGVRPVQGAPPGPLPFVSGRILVRFEPGTSPADKAAVHRLQGGRPLGAIAGLDVEVVGVPAGAEEARAAAYGRNPHVAFAEPNYLASALEDPDDPFFANQWGLDNDGQPYGDWSGTADADVDAPEAWDRTHGAPEVIVAILDSGIDQDHPDLVGKLVAEGHTNLTASDTVDDRYGHGTHVAGIAAAETGNDQGVAGMGYDATLLNVKVLDDNGWGPYSWIADGIVWATDHGARVINMSLGAYNRSRTLEAAVDYAWEQGVLLVAAAGNDGTSRRLYPAAYAHCMAVAATDDDDRRVDVPDGWASNYGDWVDVAAPGLNVLSTFPNHPFALQDVYGRSNDYDYGSGTSMATPFVAGLAALLFGQDPGRTNAEVRSLIESTADPVPGTGTYWQYGRINACNAAGGSCGYGGEEPPPSDGTLHVSSISMDDSQAGKNYFVSTTVTIVDGDGVPVSGATVYLEMLVDGEHLLDATELTAADGTASFRVKVQQPGTYVSTVTNVTYAAYIFVPGENDSAEEVVP